MEYRSLHIDEIRDLESRILFEDNHLLVFNKRSGEIVQADKTQDECLLETLKAFIAQRDNKPGKVYLGLPHRLDRPVSGVCIFAKTSKALERLNAMFRDEHSIQKTYLALCQGKPREKEALLENWLYRNEKQNKSYIVSEEKAKQLQKKAKLARLKYKLLGSTEKYFLIAVRLLSGRHHQIRCQLSHIGCTIKGDLKYGAARSNPDGGICLHAYKVEFVHPVKKEKLSITAPVIAAWEGIVRNLIADFSCTDWDTFA